MASVSSILDLSCLFETILCILEALSFSRLQRGRYGIILLALQISRVICSIVLGLHTSFQTSHQTIKIRNDGESQWLLANESTGQTVENGDAVTREHQRKHREDQGWFVYIKELNL
jgi:hypothetical protein